VSQYENFLLKSKTYNLFKDKILSVEDLSSSFVNDDDNIPKYTKLKSELFNSNLSSVSLDLSSDSDFQNLFTQNSIKQNILDQDLSDYFQHSPE
jgi:hypothetical protein